MRTQTMTMNCNDNENKYTSTYHRRRTERVIFNIIFDAFIAPVIAMIRTSIAVCIHLTVFVVIPMLFLVGSEIFGLKFHDSKVMAGFIVISSVILFIYGGFIFEHAAINLALSTSILSAFTTSIAVFVMPAMTANSYTLGACAGTGACAGALLYWFYLEPRSETLSHILCQQYGQVASLKAKTQVTDTNKTEKD